MPTRRGTLDHPNPHDRLGSFYDRPADRGHTQAAPNSNEAKVARHEAMIRQLTFLTAIGTSLALNLGSTPRLPPKTLRRATLIENVQTADEAAEALHVLRVDLGGELGAVRLHAPVSRLTRWPAGSSGGPNFRPRRKRRSVGTWI